ncbi:unnamed protein product [Lupinus luteus]|uniref:Uncharacterized protein n=1 Tax=Lupinus luteus TaxID=3873 RepID=A0AAV1Y9S9_LUPLU
MNLVCNLMTIMEPKSFWESNAKIISMLENISQRFGKLEKYQTNVIGSTATCEDCGAKGHEWFGCKQFTKLVHGTWTNEQSESCNYYDYKERSEQQFNPSYRQNNPNLSWRSNNTLNHQQQDEQGNRKPTTLFLQMYRQPSKI